MVRQLMGGKPLPAEVLAQVVAKTDGVPLFVEELVKMIMESGLVRQEADHYALTGLLPPLAIPATS
jgi:predicted ATPase